MLIKNLIIQVQVTNFKFISEVLIFKNLVKSLLNILNWLEILSFNDFLKKFNVLS